jgi:hypothetical protein
VDYENLMTEHLVDPVILDKVDVGGALQDTQKRLYGVLASLDFQSRERDYAHVTDFAGAPARP